MNYTENYKLKQPAQGDFYDVNDFNVNAAILDAELKNRETEAKEQRDSIEALTAPEFDDSGTVAGINSFPDFVATVKTKMNFFQFFRNLKAGLKFVLHTGKLVNNGLCTEPGFATDARYAKTLTDQITQLNSDFGTAVYSANLVAPCPRPTFLRWDKETLNTPYKVGLTGSAEGFAFCFGTYDTLQTVCAWEKGGNGKMYTFSANQQQGNGWKIILSNDDLEPKDIAWPDNITSGGLYRHTTNENTRLSKNKYLPYASDGSIGDGWTIVAVAYNSRYIGLYASQINANRGGFGRLDLSDKSMSWIKFGS